MQRSIMNDTSMHAILGTSMLFSIPNLKTSSLIQKRHTESLNPDMPWDDEHAFLHWGDVSTIYQQGTAAVIHAICLQCKAHDLTVKLLHAGCNS